MQRSILLAGIGALVLTGGVAVAASRPSDPPVLARADGDAVTEAPTSTTEVTLAPTTTTGVTMVLDPPTTVAPTTVPHPVEEPTTTTTSWNEPPPPPTTTVPPETTTSTTAPPPAPRPGQYAIHLECGDTADAVVCEWGDIPAGTTEQVLMRETQGPSQELDRTDDVTVRRYVDDTAEVGVSYAYRVSAYDADGRFLGTSNPIRLTHGASGGGTDS